jgi:nucleoside-diphosphate-sugar epimerase
MASTVFVIGGTGQTGRAIARRLAEHGWDVTVAARGERAFDDEAVDVVRLDRTEPRALEQAVGDSVDLVVDVIPFRPEDADQLLGLAGRAGAFVAISSASVYADDGGRSLDEASDPQHLPTFRLPIDEGTATVTPGPETYSTRKVGIEQALLGGPVPTTIVRPCAIHGPGSSWSREWYFVKRHLDRRRVVVLAGRGESVFHTTSVENLAELVRLAAEHPADRILNCGDPDPPNVLEISRAIAGAVGADWAELLLPEFPKSWDAPGVTPWSGPRSFVLDMTAAEDDLGYRPVAAYESSIGSTCEWLVAATRDREWREVLPQTAEALENAFDYAAEDTLVAKLSSD